MQELAKGLYLINSESSDKLGEIFPELYTLEHTKKAYSYKIQVVGSKWAWYPLEFRVEENLFYGLVVGNCAESGYFSLDEMSECGNVVLSEMLPKTEEEILKFHGY